MKVERARAQDTRNIRLILAYDGTGFHGWQRQPNALTVQGCLEEKIGTIVGHRIQVWGSGRTDAGAHALNQVANFRTTCRIPCENLVKALNDVLPAAVRVREAAHVPASFHARYDVRSKTYRYRILQAPVCSPFLWRYVWHYSYPLDRPRMAAAAKLVIGEHDFTSFAAAGEGSALAPERHRGAGARSAASGDQSKVRTIFGSRLLWHPPTSMLIYEVSGSGFLHHMVRNIVGTLVEVGRGRLAASDVARILEARDRTLAGPTAPAQGLCLMRVDY